MVGEIWHTISLGLSMSNQDYHAWFSHLDIVRTVFFVCLYGWVVMW